MLIKILMDHTWEYVKEGSHILILPRGESCPPLNGKGVMSTSQREGSSVHLSTGHESYPYMTRGGVLTPLYFKEA